MGMSTHVTAFKEQDEEWKKMKDVWDACEKAGIDVPKIVEKFFNYETPSIYGVFIDISDAVSEWDDKSSMSGYEVDLKKLPENTRYIRFYNAW